MSAIGNIGGSAMNVNPYAATGKLDESKLSDSQVKALKRAGKIECKTCKSRKYQDGSNDASVSYKTPTGISPSQSAGKVMAHEMEHYRHETAKANQNNEKIISISVSTSKAVCPECGATYTSGGETRVAKRKDIEREAENEYFKNKAFEKNIGKYFGKKIDTAM